MWYRLLDIFFVLFHTSLVLFNLLGWIWRKTRIANLITLGVTGASWLLLGWIVGTLGYCPLTDWHFSVLSRLGETGLPNSYMKYLVDRLTGLEVSSHLVDSVTLWTFVAALSLSLVLNVRDFRRRTWNNTSVMH